MITRMKCQYCHKRHATHFHVPTEMWQEVIREPFRWGEVCLDCFIAEADEKLIRWCEVITITPMSMVKHLELNGISAAPNTTPLDADLIGDKATDEKGDSPWAKVCGPHGRFPCKPCGTKHFEGCECQYCI